ncbi:L-seryl-tRNA(Sec) selenium transferase [Rubritalea squalenifaciens DSM 18772]|uniref:L-seryl-tRNA(Sec) selenium transferase n=1 Tax=Rubritalea squalenifaciens DSM 18772 TaxID=1123071 RepID=A0A1M6GRR1_9BACT|nr:L-seryl-tRNA(Sec) selenium transferase [Rubritalea squalenifaciens]SHJ12602.1 L-seryl-tRNA(Sec) selenium transferase [Rubritalea squalenifaciens DSM 18772]
MSQALRALPSVEKFTQSLLPLTNLPKPLVVAFVRHEVADWRKQLLGGKEASREEIEESITTALQAFAASRLQPVINGTGVLIHTNLGRSPLGKTAASALEEIATGYSNLEFNLPEGNRGKRAGYLETALACLVDAEAATAVNNCAAALVLMLRHFTSGEKKEVIVSRSELVEIGGGFRVPEILETSGAKLVEVGATNKTHLRDYEKAIGPNTALILKVHRSNFYIEGFTAEPPVPEIAELAKKHGIPLIEDLGSGAVMHTDDLAPIDHEPTPQEALRNGIDLVCFSGDKLLGGPQSGIIAGRKDFIAGIKKEPFFRAVRCDKLILAALQESIDEYLRTQSTPKETDVPVLKALAAPLDELTTRAGAIASKLSTITKGTLSVTEATATTGGGTMPRSEIPSIALKIEPTGISLNKLSRELRIGSPAIVGYTQEDSFLLDLRTIFSWQDEMIAERLLQILA